MIVGGFGALVVFIDYRPGRVSRDSWGVRSDWPKVKPLFTVHSLTMDKPHIGARHTCYLTQASFCTR